jgi:long-chain acyl-CoA synthetase
MRVHLASLVEEFRKHPTETAVVTHRGNRRYPTTYGALADLAGRFATELELRGVVPGDRVVLWGENSAEWIGVFFGCLLRGVIVVPLDAAGAPEFAGRVIQDVAPKLIVGDAELVGSLPTDNRQGTTDDFLALATIAGHLPHDPLFTVSDAVTPQIPFQIVFTSGTTHQPRGIVHTHRNILVTLEPIEREIAKYRKYERIFHPLRFLHSLPLSHVFGQFMGLWIPVLLAAEVHFAPQLEPSRITDLIRRERISVLIAVPRVLHLLRAHLLARFPALAEQIASPIEAAGVLSVFKKWWRFRRVHRALGWKFWAIISGGATLPGDLEAFWNRAGYALIQGYGMTETAALVTLNHPFHIAPGTIGKTLPGREVRITEEGEILVRGDMLAGATWQAGAMHAREGEWLATGDLAERNAAGDLRFLGRKGDVIVTGAGMNIHPADVEAALTAQPGIRSAAVVPCDLPAGTEPVAVVIFTGSDAELEAAIAGANRGLAEFQQIRRFLRWPELQFPYTSTGKLIRRQVTQWVCATLTGRQQRNGAAPTQDALLALIAEVTGEAAPAVADPNTLRLSEDLHLDSLGRVQLQSALELHFGLELEDDDLADVATVGDLRTLIDRQLYAPPALPAATGSQQAATSSQPATASREGTTRDEHLYPRWPWTWPILALRIAFIELAMRPLVWLLAKPRVIYAAPLERDTANLEPCLIIANHITAYDGALVLYALPFHLRRRIATAMSGGMLLDFRHARNQGNPALNLLAPAAYWLLTALFNVFPLPNGRGFRRSFAHAGEALDRGYSVLIFPEGTRSLTGAMNPFRPGIGLLAQQSAVPIVPVALRGLYDDAPWFHSGHVEIRVGAPIPAAAADADPAEVTAALERDLHTLLG